MIIWITGISGAGKTTIGQKLFSNLNKDGRKIIFLDGDGLRQIFASTKDKSYQRENRIKLALQYSKLCQFLSNSGLDVVIATISMYSEVYEWNSNNLDNYYEVYLKVPNEVVINRDPKGLYADFEIGKISNLAGFDLKIDQPKNPALVIENYGEITPDHAVSQIMSTLKII